MHNLFPLSVFLRVNIDERVGRGSHTLIELCLDNRAHIVVTSRSIGDLTIVSSQRRHDALAKFDWRVFV